MPTYEYACTSCGNEWEAEQSIKEAPLTECPSCKNATAKRQISRGTGFILKGGGWYSDLYATPPGKKADTADKGTSTSGSGSDKGDKGSSGSGSSGSSDSGSSSGSSGSSSSGSSSSGTSTSAAA